MMAADIARRVPNLVDNALFNDAAATNATDEGPDSLTRDLDTEDIPLGVNTNPIALDHLKGLVTEAGLIQFVSSLPHAIKILQSYDDGIFDRLAKQLYKTVISKVDRVSTMKRKTPGTSNYAKAPRSNCQVFVSTYALLMVGLDLQAYCCVAIFTDFYWYVAGLIQAGGRLIRLGQQKEVIVHILKVKNSSYDYIERIMITKIDALFVPFQEDDSKGTPLHLREDQSQAQEVEEDLREKFVTHMESRVKDEADAASQGMVQSGLRENPSRMDTDSPKNRAAPIDKGVLASKKKATTAKRVITYVKEKPAPVLGREFTEALICSYLLGGPTYLSQDISHNCSTAIVGALLCLILFVAVIFVKNATGDLVRKCREAMKKAGNFDENALGHILGKDAKFRDINLAVQFPGYASVLEDGNQITTTSSGLAPALARRKGQEPRQYAEHVPDDMK
ncbi:hypothetical protein LY76DRAFT_604489 [Colletotrichum caudatum]|nr:hypothetical protein LY76DRAFT_604489 [Colletotrichum caudatum]